MWRWPRTRIRRRLYDGWVSRRLLQQYEIAPYWGAVSDYMQRMPWGGDKPGGVRVRQEDEKGRGDEHESCLHSPRRACCRFTTHTLRDKQNMLKQRREKERESVLDRRRGLHKTQDRSEAAVGQPAQSWGSIGRCLLGRKGRRACSWAPCGRGSLAPNAYCQRARALAPESHAARDCNFTRPEELAQPRWGVPAGEQREGETWQELGGLSANRWPVGRRHCFTHRRRMSGLNKTTPTVCSSRWRISSPCS